MLQTDANPEALDPDFTNEGGYEPAGGLPRGDLAMARKDLWMRLKQCFMGLAGLAGEFLTAGAGAGPPVVPCWPAQNGRGVFVSCSRNRPYEPADAWVNA